MTPAAAKITLSRLSEYSCYKALKDEAKFQIDRLQDLIDCESNIQSPKFSGDHAQNPKSQSSRINELVSEQMECEWCIGHYNNLMYRIEVYIEKVFDGDTFDIAIEHFVNGKPYSELEEIFHFGKKSLSTIIFRKLLSSENTELI